ncbi:MAG: hypothetical protein U0235_33225 [Polyangiaceae bacterium]
MVSISGWAAFALLFVAALLPLGLRARDKKRAAPSSPPMRAHVAIGLGVTGVAFVHILFVLPALGSPAAVAGGFTALAPGALAFFVLMAHTGVGLQLRNEKLKERPKKRRLHVTTASLVALAAAAHTWLLLRT